MSAGLMMGLYALFGFERILGAGHVLWIPLLAYIFLNVKHTEGNFQLYLIILSIGIGISLMFDILGVWKYVSSNRASH